jgi:hypothetical protein
MLGKRQFSLRYLLLQIFWVAVALGTLRALASLPENPAAGPLLLIALVIAIGAAIGGCFGQMIWGVVWAVLLAIVFGLLLPATMVA